MDTDPKTLVQRALAGDKRGGVSQAAEAVGNLSPQQMSLMLQLATQSPDMPLPKWEEPYAPMRKPMTGLNVGASMPVGDGRAFINGMVDRVKGGGPVKYAGGGTVGYSANLSP